ncbi:hypothetical protein KFL_003360090 [Klebsormidium nitens]|uniref:Uncharacterized protein n=1 Tax=Klebsormidium nitens TaxID=105231 RepID=A0A1Y1IEN9_KLENI|nr:hypothetical protein KFL_003360090 [Klebsormidium nitens]|eukprot:GAQ87177.1 hypothetical protein KFL_003360090 [Klebsormidium nitens]
MTGFGASEVWVNPMEDQAPPCPSVQVFKTVRRRFQASAGANHGDQKQHVDATPVSASAPTGDSPERFRLGQGLHGRPTPQVAETSTDGPYAAGPSGQRREQELGERAHPLQGVHAPAFESQSQQPTYSLAMTPPSGGIVPHCQDMRRWNQFGPYVEAPFQEERPEPPGQLQWEVKPPSHSQGLGGHGQGEPWGMRDGPHGEALSQEQAQRSQEPFPAQHWQPESDPLVSKILSKSQLPFPVPRQVWQSQQGEFHPPESENFQLALGRAETLGGALLSRQDVGASSQGWTNDERREMQELLGCMLPSADDAALLRKLSHLRTALDEESRMKALACRDAESLRLRIYDLEARNAALDTQLHALITAAGDFSGEAALAAAQEVWQRAFESARAENQSEVRLTEARLAEGLEAERGERERLVMEAAQSRLLYRAKGRQFRMVREDLAASERRGEELERGILELRSEVEGWQRKVEALEAEVRKCGEELREYREEVENARAAGGAAEERWQGEEARRKEAELEVECLEERIRQLESHDTGALLRRYDQQLQQTRAGFHTERTRLQETIRDLQRELAEAWEKAAEKDDERVRAWEESGVNGGSGKGTDENRLSEAGFEGNGVKADIGTLAGGGMGSGGTPESVRQDAEREAAEAKERVQEIEKRLEKLQTETAELRERLDEAEKAELRRGGLEEEAERLRERCANLERGMEEERRGYLHKVERLEEEQKAHSHQVEQLEEERSAHSHQVERLRHQVLVLREQLDAVESKAKASEENQNLNAQQSEDAGKSEAAQEREGREIGEGVGSTRAQVLPGGKETLKLEAPGPVMEPEMAECGGNLQQIGKENLSPPGQRVLSDGAAYQSGGGLRSGENGRGMWFGEAESERSMLLGAAQEEIEKLQEVNGRLMEALRAAKREQDEQARSASQPGIASDSKTSKGHFSISVEPSAHDTAANQTEPSNDPLREQLSAAQLDAQKAWTEVEASRQRLAQLEEKLLAGRSLFARQEDLFRDLRAEIEDGKTRLATQAEAFRELREELLTAREELDVSRRLLRQTAPKGGDERSWVAAGGRKNEGVDLEAEKRSFRGQVIREDVEAVNRGGRSSRRGDADGASDEALSGRDEETSTDRKDDVRNGRGDVSITTLLTQMETEPELKGLPERAAEETAEVTGSNAEAGREPQIEGNTVAGGMTSSPAIDKAGERSDWDAIERESELLLRSIEQAQGQKDECENASGDESVNGLSGMSADGHREEAVHWVGEESTSGLSGGVNGLQVESVSGGPLESVAESVHSVQGHVGATSAPRETVPLGSFEAGKSEKLEKEEGTLWETIENPEDTVSASFVEPTRDKEGESPSGKASWDEVQSVGRPEDEIRKERVPVEEGRVAQRAVAGVPDAQPSESRSMQCSPHYLTVVDKSSSPEPSLAGRHPSFVASKAAAANRLLAVKTEAQSADLPPDSFPSEQLSLTTVGTGGPDSDAGRNTRRGLDVLKEVASPPGSTTELGRRERDRNGADAGSPASGATAGDSIAEVIAILGDEPSLRHVAEAGWPPGGDAGPRPRARGPSRMVQKEGRRGTEPENGKLTVEVHGSGRPEPMGQKVNSGKAGNDVWRTENRVTRLFQRVDNGDAAGIGREGVGQARLVVDSKRGEAVQTGSANRAEREPDRPISGNENVADAPLAVLKRRPVGYDANAVLRRVRKREKREREALRELRAANGTDPESGGPGKVGTKRHEDGVVGASTPGKEVRSRKVMRASRSMSPFGERNVLRPARSFGAGPRLQEDGLLLREGYPGVDSGEVPVSAAGKPKTELIKMEPVRNGDDGMLGLRVSELHRERSRLQLALAMKHAQRAAAGSGIEA